MLHVTLTGITLYSQMSACGTTTNLVFQIPKLA